MRQTQYSLKLILQLFFCLLRGRGLHDTNIIRGGEMRQREAEDIIHRPFDAVTRRRTRVNVFSYHDAETRMRLRGRIGLNNKRGAPRRMRRFLARMKPKRLCG